MQFYHLFGKNQLFGFAAYGLKLYSTVIDCETAFLLFL